MMITAKPNAPATLNVKILEEIDNRTNGLGATVSKSGGADDNKRRLGLARIAFNKLNSNSETSLARSVKSIEGKDQRWI